MSIMQQHLPTHLLHVSSSSSSSRYNYCWCVRLKNLKLTICLLPKMFSNPYLWITVIYIVLLLLPACGERCLSVSVWICHFHLTEAAAETLTYSRAQKACFLS